MSCLAPSLGRLGHQTLPLSSPIIRVTTTRAGLSMNLSVCQPLCLARLGFPCRVCVYRHWRICLCGGAASCHVVKRLLTRFWSPCQVNAEDRQNIKERKGKANKDTLSKRPECKGKRQFGVHENGGLGAVTKVPPQPTWLSRGVGLLHLVDCLVSKLLRRRCMVSKCGEERVMVLR